jgi:IS605 OrfB family transposase
MSSQITPTANGSPGPARSRYREERTLVRSLLPLPGQARTEFKQAVRRLRGHFEQFNADVGAICQWVFPLRPGSDRPIPEAQRFWELFLSPERFVQQGDESAADRLRLCACEIAFLGESPNCAEEFALSSAVQDSIKAVAQRPRTTEAQRLLARMRTYSRPHRLVLLKSAAEWIAARYLRGYENWVRHREEWIKEKTEWESKHPELTEAIRNQFNDIYRQLAVKDKRARICSWERLRQNKDNCEFAGEEKNQRHSPLCGRYREFIRDKKWKKHFRGYAEEFLKSGKRPEHPAAKKWFPAAWQEYLRHMKLTEKTLREKHGGRLPHCDKTTGECAFNPHTELCRKYKELAAKLSPLEVVLEPRYREWRGLYLREPSKRNFRYPSARFLSTPKIFGKNYFFADFKNSEVGFRLEDMAEGEFLRFRFAPWPPEYNPQPQQAEITSAHVHFVGTRPRVGFRFRVAHKPSRFGCAQERLDVLRSRQFPRESQDQLFLDAARKLLLDTFSGDAQKELRILSVDLNTGERGVEPGGASVALLVGQEIKKSWPLPVVKLEKLYDDLPKREKGSQPSGGRELPDGLSGKHVRRHLDTMSGEAAKIAEKRTEQQKGNSAASLGPHDLRSLVRHVGWMLRDWVRLNASQIIRAAEQESADLIVFESLRGFRLKGYDSLEKEKKRRLAHFFFGRIRRKVVEKAVERGMRVITVPYRLSSQVCSQCGRRQKNKGLLGKNKKKRHFQCDFKDCAYSGDSDENAARVLGKVFWGQIKLPVS